MKRTHVVPSILIALGIGFSLVLPASVQAIGLPTAFGGKVTLIRPCLGAGFVLATILQPSGTPLEVVANPSKFLYYMVAHPGQSVLGLLSTPTFCLLSPHTGFTAPSSFFYGTSI